MEWIGLCCPVTCTLWADDENTRKLTTGYVFRVLGCAVNWRSQRQSVVALSSTEAKYIALSIAASSLSDSEAAE